MDLTTVTQHQPLLKIPEENKQKKDGGNRRPLQEISNLVDFPHAPIIKSMGALSLVNDQRAEKKVTYKPEPETLVISGRSKSRSNTKKKKIHSLTSILTARSKVACGLSNKPRDEIVNIDSADTDNELAVVEYVEEIYKFYKETEKENPVFDYMPCQSNITKTMRMILIDWLVEVHNKFDLLPETLYLTINLVDRYLSRKIVSRRELQLVGISSMLLASKYEEIWAPEVNDFISISDNAYTKEHILAMEKAILEKLEWNLTLATPYVFLVRFIKAICISDKKMENMAFYLAENGLMHYHIVLSFCPSMIAAAAVYAAMHTLNSVSVWTETLEHYTGYSEQHLKECAKMLVRLQLPATDSKLKAVYRKFSSTDRDSVALLAPAKHLDC